MNPIEELAVLHHIGLGLNNIDAITSAVYPLEKQEVNCVVNSFIKQGLVSTTYSLSEIGLLELSRKIAKHAANQSEYSFRSKDGLPYFKCLSPLTKDIISHPSISFEPASDGMDHETQIFYQTSLLDIDYNIENIEIIYNLLFETEYYNPTGFWLLKYENKKLCGWGVENLHKTLRLSKAQCTLLFLCAYQHFIILLNSKIDLMGHSRLKIKLYLTKSLIPYIDTLDFLEKTLKPFLILNHRSKIPRGQEIQIKTNNRWVKKSSQRPLFTANVQGEIIHRNGNDQNSAFPYIFAVTLPKEASFLHTISPWFITCPGGCLDTTFTHRQYIHWFQIINLPEIDIATLMISKA